MKNNRVIDRMSELASPFRVTDGEGFRLANVDPGDTLDLGNEDKPKAKEALAAGVEMLSSLQSRLYADGRAAVLLIFQAMDAAGKDSTIKHVLSGVNPHGCRVHAFGPPSPEELGHDFLWRCTKRLPERGRIGIFNRSYYEETLAVRVHPELLDQQPLPPGLVNQDIWAERLRDIRNFESYLGRNGVIIRKFFLHVSKQEQKRRFLDRIDDPSKNWKFAPSDLDARAHWDDYMAAYEQTIQGTATKEAPWYVVPADHKWFTRVVVSAAIIEALAGLDPEYPVVSEEKQAELLAARRTLRDES